MQAPSLKITITLLLLGIFHFSPAQNFNAYYNFKHLNVQNGLTQNVVYHFLQDSRGYLWVGTRNGVTLFDGIRTTNFQHAENNKHSIAGNFITRILEDSGHVVWLGTDEGIERFNQEDNSFTHFPIPGASGHMENTYCVLLGLTNKYEIWFIDANSKSIKKFNSRTKEFRTVFTTDAVDGTIREDSLTGMVQIWTYLSIGTTHFVLKKDSVVKQEQFFEGKKNSLLPSLLIFHVYAQDDSTIWLATAKGLIELNPFTRLTKVYNQLNREAVNEIRYIARSPGGLLWVGTGNAGIFNFDPGQKKFIDHFRNESLDPFSICSNNIVSLYFDGVGNIWCGSYGNGCSYAHIENNFLTKHLSKTEMDRWKMENNISWLGPDSEGSIWCMIQDVQGFWKLDSSLRVKEFRQPVLENGSPFIGAVYELLFDGKSTAWCTTDRGLFLYNTETNKIKQVDYPQLSNALFGSYWSKIFLRLHDSSILFSTFGGVFRISRENGKENISPFAAMKNIPVKAFDMIFEDSAHNLFVKDTGDSLYIISGADLSGNDAIKKTLIFRPDIFQFQEMGSTIYLATNAGLFLLDKHTLTIQASPVNALLPFTSIKNILVERNKIWLFGEKGLYEYNMGEKSGRLFTVADGLPSDEFKEYSFFFTANGICIAGTTNGILSFNPQKFQDNVYPPRAQLMNMYVNDSSTGFLANPQECSKVILAHDQNTFSFDYSSISFQHAQLSSFEYKLDGFDENWIRGGNTHYTRYSRIAPGNYTFRLRAIDAKGKISPYVKTLAIEIRKAFWQTTFFKILMIYLTGFICWMLVKWYFNLRIRNQQVEFEKLQAIEKERTRIATDMHDDLGAGLSRIKFLSETIGMKKQQQLPIEEDIGSIGNYANEMIGKMGEIVWALNEKNDSLSDLLSYTRAYATEYLLTSGISCQVNAPPLFPSIFVSGEFRRNIYLTIKEALHNIVKHARADRVIISIQIDKKLRIEIIDNGLGFDRSKLRPFSNGLNNMRKRMKDISGNLEIFQEKGTRILLSAPLPG